MKLKLPGFMSMGMLSGKASSTYGASVPTAAQLQLGTDLIAEGKLEKAAEVFREIVERSQASTASGLAAYAPIVAEALVDWSVALRKAETPEVALRKANEAVKILQAMAVPTEHLLARARAALAESLISLRNYRGALEVADTALSDLVRATPPCRPESLLPRLQLQVILARCWDELHCPWKAHPFLDDALSVLGDAETERSPSLAEVLIAAVECRGLLYLRQRQGEEASADLTRAISLRKGRRPDSTQNRLGVADCLQKLGAAQDRSGRKIEGISSTEAAIAVAESLVREDSSAVAILAYCQMQYCVQLREAERVDEAISAGLASVDLFGSIPSLNRMDLRLTEARLELGTTLLTAGDSSRAEEHLQSATACAREQLANTWGGLNYFVIGAGNLASLYACQGHFRFAIEELHDLSLLAPIDARVLSHGAELFRGMLDGQGDLPREAIRNAAIEFMGRVQPFHDGSRLGALENAQHLDLTLKRPDLALASLEEFARDFGDAEPTIHLDIACFVARQGDLAGAWGRASTGLTAMAAQISCEAAAREPGELATMLDHLVQAARIALGLGCQAHSGAVDRLASVIDPVSRACLPAWDGVLATGRPNKVHLVEQARSSLEARLDAVRGDLHSSLRDQARQADEALLLSFRNRATIQALLGTEWPAFQRSELELSREVQAGRLSEEAYQASISSVARRLRASREVSRIYPEAALAFSKATGLEAPQRYPELEPLVLALALEQLAEEEIVPASQVCRYFVVGAAVALEALLLQRLFLPYQAAVLQGDLERVELGDDDPFTAWLVGDAEKLTLGMMRTPWKLLVTADEAWGRDPRIGPLAQSLGDTFRAPLALRDRSLDVLDAVTGARNAAAHGDPVGPSQSSGVRRLLLDSPGLLVRLLQAMEGPGGVPGLEAASAASSGT